MDTLRRRKDFYAVVALPFFGTLKLCSVPRIGDSVCEGCQWVFEFVFMVNAL